MKRIVLAGLLSATVALAGCGGQAATSNQSATTSAGTDASQQIANPFTDYETISDASAAAGFTLDAPESIGTYGYRTYQVCDAGESDALIQVSYSASADSDTYCYIIRKAEGTEDISGDYTSYDQMRNIFLGADRTECWAQGGKDGTINLVTWQKDGYTFSLGAYNGASMTEDEVAEIFAAIA